jgi:type VI secretion system protein ImpF
MGDPVDIPMDFDAEVDLGAGKLRMSKLRVQL